MKFNKILLATALCATASSAQAITVLQPNGIDVNFFTDSNAYNVAVFDQDDTGFVNPLDVNLALSSLGYGGTITFSESAGSFTATNSTSMDLGLGGTNEFFIAIDEIETGPFQDVNWITDSSATYYTSADATLLQYLFTTSEGLQVTVDVTAVDANISAIPVPAAAWLFASGVIGLAGIARRRA